MKNTLMMKCSEASDEQLINYFKSLNKTHLDGEYISCILDSHVVVSCEIINRVLEQKPFLANAVYDEYYCTEYILINLIDDTSIVICYTYDM